MKQLLQQVSGGEIEVVDVPARIACGLHIGRRQDKGHRGEWEAFVAALRTGADCPLPLAEIVTTMRATFAFVESRFSGQPILVGGFQS